MLIACFSTGSIAADDSIAERAVQLLKNQCTNCHGAEQAEGGLRLDSREAMLVGGERGPTFSPSQPLNSLLLQSITHASSDLAMPPKQSLHATDIELVRSWLLNGAAWPEPTVESMSANQDPDDPIGNAWTDARNPIHKLFGGKRLDLWSLRPVTIPELPKIDNQSWVQNELDWFTLARLEKHNVKAPELASRHHLVRRLYFDLIGLPPSFEDSQRFEAGDESQSLNELVDTLLSSPRFGEHWARMWLDLVRYSDSNGFDWDEFRPQAWRYRDYVVRSLNADKPYDQMIREQLAGDELFNGAPASPSQQDSLLATGYLRMGPHDNAAKLFNEQDRSRDEWLTDLVETTGTAFLGLTLSCCRCHDHKYDPISQEDHFRIRACFAGLEFADGLAIDLQAQQELINQHNDGVDQSIQQVEQRQEKAGKETAEAAMLAEEIKNLQARRQQFTYAMLALDRDGDPAETFVLFQGDYRSPRQRVEAGVLSVLDPNRLQKASSQRTEHGGRRLALANWITSSENPLTARVLVNRVWQQLIGHGIVRTPGDFGLAGLPPDEPELLDYLAARFVADGWSIKRLIRLMVLSATYQQACRYSEEPIEVAHLFRQPRRLTAEQQRDAMLFVSGLMTGKAFGPPEWPDLPKDVLEANPAFLDDNEAKTKGWYPSAEDAQHCRSLFLVQKRNTRVPMLETFDQPENSVSCTCRLSSVVAPQALAMLNGPEAAQAARAMAKRVALETEQSGAQIHLAFQYALQRSPLQSELDACQRMAESTSLMELCRVLLNLNEFTYLD